MVLLALLTLQACAECWRSWLMRLTRQTLGWGRRSRDAALHAYTGTCHVP